MLQLQSKLVPVAQGIEHQFPELGVARSNRVGHTKLAAEPLVPPLAW